MGMEVVNCMYTCRVSSGQGLMQVAKIFARGAYMKEQNPKIANQLDLRLTL